ncbi:MAG: 4Fe-4S binding protein [bacterium]
MVNLTINGIPIQVDEGKTILQAAKSAGISIPTLCYNPILEPYSACRVCAVEVKQNGHSTLTTSCNTKVQEGMEVWTDSEQAIRARKLNLELLLAQAPAAEVVQKLARQYGIEKPRFPIGNLENKCILCGLCVQACEKIAGVSAIGFANRGIDRVVTTPFDEPSQECILCGACAQVCPTGHIQMESLDEQNYHAYISLAPDTAITIPFRQAIPNVPYIRTDECIHFKTGACRLCAQVCEKNAIDHNMTEEKVEFNVGAIILATGFKTFDPTHLSRYGYGHYRNVITGLEFEIMNNAGGPTGGAILTAEGKPPKSVAIIHCVGSRDKNTNPWCSRVCCMYSLKFAHLIKEKTGAEVYNLYIDMRTPGKGYEEFYDRLLEENVHFIRGRAAEVTDWVLTPEEEGKLIVRVEDTLLGMVRRIPVDMVILSVGLEPQKDAGEIRRLFNISCSQEGWFLERHPKLAPISTFTDGIFLAGACQGPKDIPDTVAQAGAAAAEALALIDKGYVEIEPNIAEIDETLCSGCRLCSALCPFNAITFDAEKFISVINPALCKGCGTCVASCPSGAAKQNLFTDEQIFQEIEGILAYV